MKKKLITSLLVFAFTVSFAQISGATILSKNNLQAVPVNAKYVTSVDDRIYFINDKALNMADDSGTVEISLNASFGQIIGAVNGNIYFSAYTPELGEELYKHDGSKITLVKDITKGSGSTSFHYHTSIAAMDKLYFVAEDGISGKELWVTDGKTASLVADIAPGKQDALPGSLTLIEDELYFSASNGVGREMYCYTNGQVKKIQNDQFGYASVGASTLEVIQYQGSTYFTAKDIDGDEEIWKYDGRMVSKAIEINPDESASPEELIVFNDKLLFAATCADNGVELFAYNGSRLELVADINPGMADANPRSFTELNGLLYFTANSGIGNRLWSYDGTNVAIASEMNP